MSDNPFGVEIGDKVMYRASERSIWYCGLVASFTEQDLFIRHCSQISHTGGWWSDTLLLGAKAPGWESASIPGTQRISLTNLQEILFMGPNALLPEVEEDTVSEGDSVIVVFNHRHLCGRIKSFMPLVLEESSWVDKEHPLEDLIKGPALEGWSSEFQGYTVLPGSNYRLVLMAPEAFLPLRSYRPNLAASQGGLELIPGGLAH